MGAVPRARSRVGTLATVTTPCLPTLAATRSGHGAPLLLLHGIGSSKSDWATLLRHLTPDFDVLAVDLPGHGQSPPPGRPTVGALTDAVEADLDARGLETVGRRCWPGSPARRPRPATVPRRAWPPWPTRSRLLGLSPRPARCEEHDDDSR